jgi:hypothetical protein
MCGQRGQRILKLLEKEKMVEISGFQDFETVTQKLKDAPKHPEHVSQVPNIKASGLGDLRDL